MRLVPVFLLVLLAGSIFWVSPVSARIDVDGAGQVQEKKKKQ